MTFFLLGLSYIFGWIFPPAFAPIQFSLIGSLLLKWLNPWLVGIVTVIFATISYVPLWILIDYLFKKASKEDAAQDEDWIDDGIIASKKAEQENIVYVLIKKTFSATQYKKFALFMDQKTGKIVVFLIAIFLCAPIVSDLMAILLLRWKLSLKIFLVAGFIAKALVIFPLVLLGEWVISYFSR